MTRICYITTEEYRVYFYNSSFGYSFSFFRHKNNQWLPVNQQTLGLKMNNVSLNNENEFVESLLEIFYWQFPEARLAYWETLPSMQTTMNSLYECRCVSCMESRHYKCLIDNTIQVDDADGITTIICCDGYIMVPHNIVEGRNLEYIFQVNRALEHPDCGVVLYFFKQRLSKIKRFCDFVKPSLWIRFREYLEQE